MRIETMRTFSSVITQNNTREVLMESLMLIPCRIPCDFDSPSAYYKILKTRF